MKLSATTTLLISTLALKEFNNASAAFAPQSHTPSSVAFHNTLSKSNINININSARIWPSTSIENKALNALPGGGSEFFDLHQSLSSLSHLNIFDPATSTLLSDAAAAAVEETSGGGLWDQYLELFKYSLEFVHSVIDQPLKNAGFDQTWGVSIFAFTFCK